MKEDASSSQVPHRLLGAGIIGVCLVIELQLVVDLYRLLLAVIGKVQLHSNVDVLWSDERQKIRASTQSCNEGLQMSSLLLY